MAANTYDLGTVQSNIHEIRIAQIGDAREAAQRHEASLAWLRLIAIGLYAGMAANLTLAFAVLLLVLTK